MSAPVVPTPDVERRVSVLVVPVPPMCSGKVAEVVNVGVTSVGLVNNVLTVTFFVVLDCTTGSSSVPASGVVAEANCEIFLS